MENFENNLERINTKEKLQELEASEDYLFHGSPYAIDTFEPRQAYTDVDNVSVADGEPAVFASTEIETPIFRSIFHEARFTNLQGSYELGFTASDDGDNYTHANQACIDVCKDQSGYVYVFKRDDFTQRFNTEWTASVVVKPVGVFHSNFEDIGIPIQSSKL